MPERDAVLPTGTVSFLFTDIEGSTQLLQVLGAEYGRAQDAHAAILRAAIADGEGVEIRTEGDSFFAVFPSAAAAVTATVEAQRALRSHVWPDNGEIRVRMGVHTGEGALGGDDYIGIDVNRAARIAACGHGGQVLVSEATATLVAGGLPPGVHLEPLGAYRLKDLPEPERIHQLAIDGLPASFPPLRALDARRSHLPVDATSFIGRTGELRSVEELVAGHRLVTLTGPGGIGKTRLALRAAADVAERFRDGAFFVPLATVTAAQEVPAAIAAAIGVPERPGTPVAETLFAWLGAHALLLVLDNLEQIEGVPDVVASLLQTGDDVRVLSTSRAPLRLPGEQEFPVPAFLPPRSGPGASDPEASDAVELFLDRALLIRPDFAPDPEELAVVGEIATRLEGMPLSIELAAARVRTLSVVSIRDRLDRRLDTLVGGASTLPDRQRTLREAIAWSDDLLDAQAKVVFHRLAAFVGGWALEAAERVVADGVDDVSGTLESLVEQSLVQASASGAEARFTMLETIREFAAERLEASGEREATYERHGAYFAEIARAGEAALRGEGSGWLDRLDADLDNLRAAIARAQERGDPRTALSIAAGLERFWLQRNRSAEGRQILSRLIDGADASLGVEYARATSAAASMEVWLGNYAAGRVFGERSVAAYREIDDRAGLVEPLGSLGFAMIEVDPERALATIEESLELAGDVGDVRALATTPLARAIALFRLGRLADARSSLEDAVDRTLKTGDRYFGMMSRYALARTELLLGETENAMRDYRQALEDSRDADLRIGVAVGLDNYAEIALGAGDVPRAVRLASAASRMKDELGGGPPSSMIGAQDPLIVGREALGDEAFEAESEAGRTMTMETAISEALAARPNDGPE